MSENPKLRSIKCGVHHTLLLGLLFSHENEGTCSFKKSLKFYQLNDTTFLKTVLSGESSETLAYLAFDSLISGSYPI
jgi:hypothetical protein